MVLQMSSLAPKLQDLKRVNKNLRNKSVIIAYSDYSMSQVLKLSEKEFKIIMINALSSNGKCVQCAIRDKVSIKGLKL